MPFQDILTLPENKEGKDIIIGDVHGNRIMLESVVNSLTPNDRLFIVGDLIDRGSDSPGVLETIMKNQNRIFVIKGNHEELFLRYANERLNPNRRPDAQQITSHYLDQRIGGIWAEQITDEKLKQFQNFISHLPYVIRVEGSRPFNLVHADMPFNDTELQRRIATQLNLTPDEINYATWARTGDAHTAIKDTGRTSSSDVTYCGHTIGGGTREQTNHVNLDIGSFTTQLCCAVNHSETKAYLFSKDQVIQLNSSKIDIENKDSLRFPNIHSAIASVKEYLDRQRALQQKSGAVNTASSLNNLPRFFSDLASKYKQSELIQQWHKNFQPPLEDHHIATLLIFHPPSNEIFSQIKEEEANLLYRLSFQALSDSLKEDALKLDPVKKALTERKNDTLEKERKEKRKILAEKIISASLEKLQSAINQVLESIPAPNESRQNIMNFFHHVNQLQAEYQNVMMKAGKSSSDSFLNEQMLDSFSQLIQAQNKNLSDSHFQYLKIIYQIIEDVNDDDSLFPAFPDQALKIGSPLSRLMSMLMDALSPGRELSSSFEKENSTQKDCIESAYIAFINNAVMTKSELAQKIVSSCPNLLSTMHSLIKSIPTQLPFTLDAFLHHLYRLQKYMENSIHSTILTKNINLGEEIYDAVALAISQKLNVPPDAIDRLKRMESIIMHLNGKEGEECQKKFIDSLKLLLGAYECCSHKTPSSAISPKISDEEIKDAILSVNKALGKTAVQDSAKHSAASTPESLPVSKRNAP